MAFRGAAAFIALAKVFTGFFFCFVVAFRGAAAAFIAFALARGGMRDRGLH